MRRNHQHNQGGVDFDLEDERKEHVDYRQLFSPARVQMAGILRGRSQQRAPPQQQQQQYHSLMYGSMDFSTTSGTMTIHSDASNSVGGGGSVSVESSEMLLGESLVPTDNEEDTSTSAPSPEHDLPPPEQLLIATTSLSPGLNVPKYSSPVDYTASPFSTLSTSSTSPALHRHFTPPQQHEHAKGATVSFVSPASASPNHHAFHYSLPPPPPPPPSSYQHSSNGTASINNKASSITATSSTVTPSRRHGRRTSFEIITRYPMRFIWIMIAVLILVLYYFTWRFDGEAASSASSDFNSSSTAGSNSNVFKNIPFRHVDRATFNDNVEQIINPSLFHPSLLYEEEKGRGLLDSSPEKATMNNTTPDSRSIPPVFKFPFPTGAFWTNLVVEPQQQDRKKSFPIVAYPYAFQWSSQTLEASYSAIRRQVKPLAIHDIFAPDITFGTREIIASRHIMKFDPLSVTLRYSTSDRDFSLPYWETFLVQGSPYITMEYHAVTPILKALSAFEKVMCPFDTDGKYYDGEQGETGIGTDKRKLGWGVCAPANSGSDSSGLYGVQFLLQTQRDMTWILFASEPIHFSFDTVRRTEVVAAEPFTGTLRLALIPPTASDDGDLLKLSESLGLKRLVYHAHVYPTGGDILWDVVDKSISTSSAGDATPNEQQQAPFVNTGSVLHYLGQRTATVRFQYNVRIFNGDAEPIGSSHQSRAEDLLMLALPHHVDVLTVTGSDSAVLLNDQDFDLSYRCIKGIMAPVVGSIWTMEEKLTTTTWDYGNDNSKSMDMSTRSVLLESLKGDMQLFPPLPSQTIYGFGKQLARLAQLAHVASSILVTVDDVSVLNLLETIVAKLYSSIRPLLDGEMTDELVYDAKLGGIVPTMGLLDPQQDYGSGRYNDHHFHYGYILYASSVLGILNASFVEEYRDTVDAILYDIAYNGNGDSNGPPGAMFFPLARMKSWYDGHSFASGLFPFANGKSQESSSEAVNAYFGAYLWSLAKAIATGDNSLSAEMDFGRLLLATELRSSKKYWHMNPANDEKVYDAPFEQNYMVGNVGMLDVTCSTWFSTNPIFVHFINVLPVTAITRELFDPDYAHDEHVHAIQLPAMEAPEAWRGYAACLEALAFSGNHSSSLWTGVVQQLDSARLDAGISKTLVLYFMSRLDGFQAPPPAKGNDDSTSDDALCQSHANCRNLVGYCCPTATGIMLGCC